MGPAEVFYRVSNVLRAQLEKRGIGLAKVTVPCGETGRPWVAPLPRAFEVARYTDAADRILAGYFDVFALEGAQLGFPPEWNRDCRTGIVAPMEFGKTLDYRDERKVGDIKYLWEPSRHLELVTLAQAWHLSGEQRYAEGCRMLLDSWFDQCPYPYGVHWTSSLEHSVRLLNWYFAWHLLGGEDSTLFDGVDGGHFKARWLESVYQHCHFIAGHFSRHSSANNHLLGEYLGLLVGSFNWPLWEECPIWQKVAVRGFEEESLKQNAADGVNREQAIYYQHEVMDMMFLCRAIAKAHGHSFSADYHKRLEKLAEFVAAVMNMSGEVPMIGDSDDAVLVRLSQESNWDPYRSLLATCALIFDNPVLGGAAGRADDKTRWLLGDKAAETFPALSSNARPQLSDALAFPEGGYYLLSSDRGKSKEVLALADCGPLGYLSIAAHGHADALSFCLSIAGDEILVDPGTFAYHTQRSWRDYFRGTSAHNTLRIDCQDQSEIGGNFMWLRKAQASLIEHGSTIDGRQVFAGEHNGYLRLETPALHRRRIEFDPEGHRFAITDKVITQGEHEVELFWHFAERCEVAVNDRSIEWQTAHARGSLSLDVKDFSLELLSGSDSPPAGWISRRFDCREPIVTARYHARTHDSVHIVTTIEYSFFS